MIGWREEGGREGCGWLPVGGGGGGGGRKFDFLVILCLVSL